MNDTIKLYDTDLLNGAASYDSADYEYRFIAEHVAKFEGPKEREITYISASWNFMILFFVMILMVLNKFFSQQKLVAVVSKPFQNNNSDRMIRENHSFLGLQSVSVVASFILILSLFIQKIYIVYGSNRILYDNFDFYIDVVICVTAMFVFNYLLVLFYSWIFKTDALLVFHVSLHVSAMATSNFLMMPIILILFFHPYKYFLIFTMIILAILFLVRFSKSLIEVRMLSKLNFVNIFLYLCTIEILPILVVAKMIVNVL